MAITVLWDNPDKTIIRHIVENRWDWNDFYTAMAETYTLLDSVNEKVDLILDLQKSTVLPSGAVAHLRSLGYQIHPNIDRIAFVGENPLIKMLYSIFQRMYPQDTVNTMLLSTLEEARALFSDRPLR